MSRFAALRALLMFALVVLMQCVASPEMRMAWLVAAGALGLLAVTAATAILLSGQYWSK